MSTVVDSISAALVRAHSHHPPAGTIYHPSTTWPILRTSHAKSKPVGQWTLTILCTLAMTANGQVWQPLKAVASKVMKALGGGWALKTECGHTGAINRYLGFCKEERVPQDLRLPAQEQVIVVVAASWAGTISGLTVCKDIAGLHAWHTQHNLAWPKSSRLYIIIEGVGCLHPKSSRQAERALVTLDMLQWLLNGLDGLNNLDKAIRLCALVAFWGQCRLSKLLPGSGIGVLDHLSPIV
jgi:hypothetical protein